MTRNRYQVPQVDSPSRSTSLEVVCGLAENEAQSRPEFLRAPGEPRPVLLQRRDFLALVGTARKNLLKEGCGASNRVSRPPAAGCSKRAAARGEQCAASKVSMGQRYGKNATPMPAHSSAPPRCISTARWMRIRRSRPTKPLRSGWWALQGLNL